MSPEAITALGLVAGALTTVAFVPQLLLVVRTRRTQDISLGMFLIFSAGVALWLVYGLLLGALPVVIANGITLVLALCILYYKVTLK